MARNRKWQLHVAKFSSAYTAVSALKSILNTEIAEIAEDAEKQKKMGFRDKFVMTSCHLRSTCREDADRAAFKSLFEREWEVFVVKRDPASGKFHGHTLCCETATVPVNYGRSFETACC